jgi:hypothetical protein
MTPDQGHAEHWPLSPAGWFLLGAGVAVFFMGAWVFSWASPSPHGYIEIFFAVPLMSIGGILAAVGLLISHRRLSRLMRILAWLLLIGSLAPITSVIHLWVSSRP